MLRFVIAECKSVVVVTLLKDFLKHKNQMRQKKLKRENLTLREKDTKVYSLVWECLQALSLAF